ncbi:MAG: penicillin-binding transpeptidase domain-containing protein [Spirochaetia bacterium]|nr:penicillin-binding transpeptidase domain-containing protein [Spirochaetia bacterium]
MNSLIQEFSRHHPGSSVIIYNPDKGHVEYVFNRETAFRGFFSPGSIIKVFSAMAFMENAGQFQFNPSRRIICRGKYFLLPSVRITPSDEKIFNIRRENDGRRYLRCSKSHGPTDLHNAIAHSCNVYFLSYAEKNSNLIYKILVDRWKLNSSVKGSLNGAQIKLSANPFPGEIEILASSIGEGGLIRISPLKAAQIFGSFFIQKNALIPSENIKANSATAYSMHYNRSAANDLLKALQAVHQTGTLSSMKITNSRVKILASKTGTGTQYGKIFSTHAWNVIYFQIEGKKRVLVTFVKKGYGGKEAGQLSRLVINHL